MAYEKITSERDPLLSVLIDRDNPAAMVWFLYDNGDGDEEEQSTMFQTADMPMDDQKAANMVEDWIQ